MRVVALNMPYKGDRDYLHGTDMYAQAVEVLSSVQPKLLAGKCKQDFRII